MRFLSLLLIVIATSQITRQDLLDEGCKISCWNRGLLGYWDHKHKKCFCGKHYDYPRLKRDWLPGYTTISPSEQGKEPDL